MAASGLELRSAADSECEPVRWTEPEAPHSMSEFCDSADGAERSGSSLKR